VPDWVASQSSAPFRARSSLTTSHLRPPPVTRIMDCARRHAARPRPVVLSRDEPVAPHRGRSPAALLATRGGSRRVRPELGRARAPSSTGVRRTPPNPHRALDCLGRATSPLGAIVRHPSRPKGSGVEKRAQPSDLRAGHLPEGIGEVVLSPVAASPRAYLQICGLPWIDFSA